jgi:hypothetical protein
MKKIIVFMFVVLCTNIFSMDLPDDTARAKWLIRVIETNNNGLLSMGINVSRIANVYCKYEGASRELFGEVTPLHVAVYKDNSLFVEHLLLNGADPNLKTIHCSEPCATPLHYVRSRKVTRLLIENGARVNEKDCCGQSPLYNMLFHPWRGAHMDNAQYLIDKGAGVNERYGVLSTTLLHKALEHGRYVEMIVSFLLQNGADRYAKTKHGYTPLDYAKIYLSGRKDILDLLR